MVIRKLFLNTELTVANYVVTTRIGGWYASIFLNLLTFRSIILPNSSIAISSSTNTVYFFHILYCYVTSGTQKYTLWQLINIIRIVYIH